MPLSKANISTAMGIERVPLESGKHKGILYKVARIYMGAKEDCKDLRQEIILLAL